MADLIFTINGTDYPIDDVGAFVNSLTLDESRIFHDWTGGYIEDIAEMRVSSMMIAAFMQVAYMRGNPQIPAHTARDAVGASNLMEALERFNASAEAEVVPLAPTRSETAPDESPAETNDSPNSSGVGSTTPSDAHPNVRSPGGSPLSVVTAMSASTTSGS